MAHRNKTLRGMSPTTRKLARLGGELESVARRLENALPEVAELEHDSRALHNHVCSKTVTKTMFCPTCKKDVKAVQWSSQPILVCPDCGQTLGRTDGESLPTERIVIDGVVVSSTRVIYSLCEDDIITVADERDQKLTEEQLNRLVKMVEAGNGSMESIQLALDEVVGDDAQLPESPCGDGSIAVPESEAGK